MRSRKRQCIKCSRDYWWTFEGWCGREDWWIRKGCLRLRTRIQGNLELEAHRIGKSEHAKRCRGMGVTYQRGMACISTMCVAIIFMSAAAFFSRTTFVTATARQKAPRGVQTAMERTTSPLLVPISRKDEGGWQPQSQQELRDAAKSARAEAAKWELLAAAAERRGVASEPEDQGRGRTRLRERRDTRSLSSGDVRSWKEKSTEDKKRRMGENREKMKTEVVRSHQEKKENKEAVVKTRRDNLLRGQMEREEICNETRRQNEEANKAAREKMMKAKREAARKAVEKTNAEKKKKKEEAITKKLKEEEDKKIREERLEAMKKEADAKRAEYMK